MPGPLRTGPTLDGYPQGHAGDRYASCVDHVGPASYAVVVNGTPPTGGDPITAAEFGLKALTMVWGSISDNGQYLAICTPGVSGKGEPTSWTIMYVTAATGAQVTAATPLNGRTFRLFAIGR